MKKIMTAMLLVVLVLAGAAWGGIRYFESLDRNPYAADAVELDLSGMKDPDIDALCGLSKLKRLNLLYTGITDADYEKLRKALPDCRIMWQVPFQGNYLELNTRQITVESLTDEDVELLRYLTKLESVDARQCGDLDQIMSLREKYPQILVDYRVPVGGRELSCTTVNLMVADPDPEELTQMLQYLPELQKVTFTGEIRDRDAILELENTYPQIAFLWNIEIAGRKFLNTTREVDLSGVQVEDLEEVAAAYPYFDNLEKVILCDCGKTSEELDAFWKKYPEVRVVWSVRVQFFKVRTDVTTLMPFKFGCGKLSNSNAESLKYLVDLVCVDFGHMGMTDLSFLEYTPNIEYLIVADSRVSDITPIGNLKKLKYLEIFLNHITDISPLAGCTELRDLNMCYNLVSDFTPLLELEHLENLWIKGNYMTREKRMMLEEAFPNARIVFDNGKITSTDAGWRRLPRYYEQRDLLGMWYMYEE